ncbi:MAG: hypothetical protein R6V00_03500 [Candidatus Aminicenantes bacterium]
MINTQGVVAQQETQKLLTPEDVEEVTGMKDLQLIQKGEEEGAVGDLNFTKQDGTPVLMMNVQSEAVYEAWKNQEGIFHSDVQGLGDEAFKGPETGDSRYILVFRKGKHAVSFSSYFETEEKPFLSVDDLKKLADTVDSRL